MIELNNELLSYAQECAKQRSIEICTKAGLPNYEEEDIAQDVLMRMCNKWKSFDETRASAKTFLDRISHSIRNTLSEKIQRKQEKERQFSEKFFFTEGYDPVRSMNLLLDIEHASHYLSKNTVIWFYLMLYDDPTQLCKVSGIKRQNIQYYIKRMRSDLAAHGIGAYFGERDHKQKELDDRPHCSNQKEWMAIAKATFESLFHNGIQFCQGYRKLPMSWFTPRDMQKVWEQESGNQENAPKYLAPGYVRMLLDYHSMDIFDHMSLCEVQVFLSPKVKLEQRQIHYLLCGVAVILLHHQIKSLEEEYGEKLGEPVLTVTENLLTYFYACESDDYMYLSQFRLVYRHDGATMDDLKAKRVPVEVFGHAPSGFTKCEGMFRIHSAADIFGENEDPQVRSRRRPSRYRKK